ncbi:MAG: succinate dehydrogenase, cytochrome b556 subunit [Xanthomonadales bacterium]|nr:succinate dehydrogenase, cytochrome b556 subunit [Xanthomonadales bacterium]
MKPESRPMSPYMIGPYYKPQLTSMLSILSRLTGVVLTAVTTPLALIWVLALASGPSAYGAIHGFLHSLVGKVLVLTSLFSLCYHLVNGIRHLIWDTGAMFDIQSVYRSGYAAVVISIVLFALVVWFAS